MRKENLYGMPRGEARALLERAAYAQLASTSPDGAPILRTLNAAVLGERVVFHGAPIGEKTLALGRACVVGATEIVADVPSHFVDDERACPATTLYRSVQVHGVLEPIADPATKTAALQALMDARQPEGGYVPLHHEHPLYAKSIASLLVFGVSLERIDGKAKLAQNRSPAERRRLVEGLWRRGRPGDARAIDLVMRANGDAPPPFLRTPDGTRARLAPTDAHAREAAALLEGTYWNDRFTPEELVAAHLGSSAWIVLEDDEGRTVASARAISDGRKRAWIYDVIVEARARGRGLGDALVRLLLDHPAVRGARLVHLGTRDAAPFYARMGFVPVEQLPPRPYRTVEMALVRGARDARAPVLAPVAAR